MSERPTVYVCSRVDEGPSHVAAFKRNCGTCGAEVWVSVRMQRDPMVAAMEIACTRCAFPKGLPTPFELMRGVVKGDVVLHPIALDEIRRHIEGENTEVGHD